MDTSPKNMSEGMIHKIFLKEDGSFTKANDKVDK